MSLAHKYLIDTYFSLLPFDTIKILDYHRQEDIRVINKQNRYYTDILEKIYTKINYKQRYLINIILFNNNVNISTFNDDKPNLWLTWQMLKTTLQSILDKIEFETNIINYFNSLLLPINIGIIDRKVLTIKTLFHCINIKNNELLQLILNQYKDNLLLMIICLNLNVSSLNNIDIRDNTMFEILDRFIDCKLRLKYYKVIKDINTLAIKIDSPFRIIMKSNKEYQIVLI